MKRIGIIGAGMISNSHAKALAAMDNAVLCAVADINQQAADAFSAKYDCKAYYDAEKMLLDEKPDAVIICLPTFLHEKYVSLCASHKVNVMCEKPVEMTVPATERMLKSVKDSGIIFMVAQVVRFWQGYEEIKAMADAGELGHIYMAYASRCSTMQSWGNTWLNDPEKGAGAIQDMHVHDVDYLRYLCGEIDYVYCLGSKDDTKCWNHVMSSISFKNGQKAVAEAAFTMQHGYPFTMSLKVVGTKTTAEYLYRAGYSIGDRDSVDTELKLYRSGKDPLVMNLEPYDAYEKQLKYFVSCLEQNKQPDVVPHQQNLDVIRAVCAIRESVETNSIIKL